MKLAGRITVEPLTEERLTSIERRVVAGAADAASRAPRLWAPRRHAGWAAAAIAVIAAGFAGWVLHAPPGAPGGADPAPLRVATDEQRTRVDIGDARIESDAATAFEVTRPGGGVLVALSRGKLELEVGKRGARPPLVVRAGETDVIVIGTRFTVDYGDGRGEVAVHVSEGVVRVVHHQQETRVAAGQDWQTQAGLVAGEVRGGGRVALGSAPAAAGDGSVAPARAQSGTAGTPGQLPEGPPEGPHDHRLPEGMHEHKAAIPEAPGGAGELPPRSAAAPGRSSHGDAVRQHARPRPSDPSSDLKSAIRAQRVEPALDLGEPDATSAIARYYDIAAHRSGDAASQAFYSIAVVQHEKLAHGAEALQTLDAYVRRFHGSKEYRAALWLRVRILCLDKIDDRCRAAAYRYLHEAPDGPAAHVAESITVSE